MRGTASLGTERRTQTLLVAVLAIAAIASSTGCALELEDPEVGRSEAALAEPRAQFDGTFVNWNLYQIHAALDYLTAYRNRERLIQEQVYRQLAGPQIYAATRNMTTAQRIDWLENAAFYMATGYDLAY